MKKKNFDPNKPWEERTPFGVWTHNEKGKNNTKIDWNKLWDNLPENLAGDPNSMGYSRTREEVQQLKFVVMRLVDEINKLSQPK